MIARARIPAEHGELPIPPNRSKRGVKSVPKSCARILLAERACAEKYPPLLHQAAILRQTCHVTLLDALGQQDDAQVQTEPEVERIRVSASDNGTSRVSIANAKWALRYASEFR